MTMIRKLQSCLVTLAVFTIITAYRPSPSPQYCSNEDLTNSRKIPNLSSTDSERVSSLKQVQMMIRHGARTPYAKLSCWKDYNFTWSDCGVTELMIPSPSYLDTTPPAKWLFRKLYDGSENNLGGNCLTGQLLADGYHQEVAMGQVAKSKYIGKTDASKGDYKLFESSVWDDVDIQKIYFRSDDEERTLLSGQALVSGMFISDEDVIIPWHTGDYKLDQIRPNRFVCPELISLTAAATRSPEFYNWESSPESASLMKTVDDIFGEGTWTWDDMLDCLMTAACTGRQIPNGSVERAMDNDIFYQIVSHVEYNFSYVARYNNSAWSKVAINNLSFEILRRIKDAEKNSATAMNFVLYAGHDTTLMPFLAAVLGDTWDGKWASYASMIVIELYNSSFHGGSDLFRVIYNGVYTQIWIL